MKRCQYCLSTLPVNKQSNTYCDHKCRGAASKIPSKPCAADCGAMVDQLWYVDNKKRRLKQYCSQLCINIGQRQKQLLKIETSRTCIGYVAASNYLIAKFGRKCAICSNSEWMGKPIPLERDHIDGDGTNHLIENQRLLCPNCHAQTPTFKAKNKGNGRIARRTRAQADYHRAK